MGMLFKYIRGNSLNKFFSSIILLLFLFLFAGTCLDDVNSPNPDNPFGPQIIVLNALPPAIFGNGCSFSEVEVLVNPSLTIDGSTIKAEIFSDNLPDELRGCITSADTVVSDGSAKIEYLGGPLVGLGVGSVNVSVTSILPNGEQQSSFVPITIVGVDIVEILGPESITTNPMSSTLPPVFTTIEVITSGILPGTFVDFEITDPSCGFLSGATPVLGTAQAGIAVVEYNAFDGIGCTQTVFVTIIIGDPRSKSAACESVPVGLRTIQAAITFEQISPPTPTPTPTPSPTPGPSPTPTPTPTPTPGIDVEAFNEELPPGGETIITATTNTGSNTDVCCDIPRQSDPDSSLDGFPPTPVCGVTDVNGSFVNVFTAGLVDTFDTVQVRCCIDTNTIPSACDPEEPQDSVFVDINPSGVPPPIELVAIPSTIPPGGESSIIASTTPEVFPGEICFEIVIGTSSADLFNGGPSDGPLCFATTSEGQAVVGLKADPNVTTQAVATVLGCINLNPADDMCDPTDPSNFVTVIITPPLPTPTPTPTPTPAPTPTPTMAPSLVQIVAVNPFPPAGGSTFIDVFTNPPAILTDELCVEIISNSTPASTITGPLVGPPVGTACANPNVGGDVIGLISLNIDPLASGDQISLQGCIDINTTLMCDAGDTFSPIIIVNVP